MKIQMPIDKNIHIYHFTKSETALLYILPQLQLRLSSYLESNDPKENKTFGYWSIFDGIDSFTQLEMRRNFESYLKDNCKQLCFSTDYMLPNSCIWRNGFDHPSMWAHYADNSKGVCLVINRADFVKENLIDDSLDIIDKVIYEPCFEFPKMNEFLWREDNLNYFNSFLRENAKEIFFKKHLHWRHEDEYKIIGLGNKMFYSIKDSLKGVYIGVDFKEMLKPMLKKLLPENVWVEKIWIDEGSFCAISDDLNNI